jgi:hypothetical protein
VHMTLSLWLCGAAFVATVLPFLLVAIKAGL